MNERKMIKNMKRYEPNEYKNCIKLDANERFDLEMINLSKKSFKLNRYPDNDSKELKKAIGEYISIDPSNLVVGNGSSEMIELMLKGYIEPGDTVLSFTPSFVMYQVFCEIYNGKFIGVSAKDDYIFDMDDMILAAKKYKPKMIFLCNPNNPTGFLFRKDEIERLLKNVDCIVVVDEAYIEFAEGSLVNRIDSYDNLVVLRTFSKAWGLAGIRLGYMISNEKNINVINKIKSPYNLNLLTQSMGMTALENREVLLDSVKTIIDQRESVYKALVNLGTKVYKSSANFIYFKSEIDIFDKLVELGVVIRSFRNGFYRVTIGTEEENKVFLKSMKSIYDNDYVEIRGVI